MKPTLALAFLLLGGCGTMPTDQAAESAAQPVTTANPESMEESDGSETPDLCPNDPEKLIPGICGCNVADTDADRDGTPDCLDDCPDDPNKTTLELCGCGVPDTDVDGDDTPDCLDLCPNHPEKTEPGLCGCGQPENGIDTDADGVPDCVDQCPLDPIKIVPGICGCGTDDLDLDRDGFPDLCFDNCAFTFNPDQLDSDSDGLGDTCDPFPVGSGDVFSFLTPDETELFLLFVDRLNADIDSLVDSALSLALMELGSRGLGGGSLACGLECDAEQTRIEAKREGTAISAIDAAASRIDLTLGLFERQEIDAFNCENYPNHSLACGTLFTCTIGGPPCD